MHIDRERAASFGRAAERYDRARPGYPDDLVTDVLGPAPEGLSVLDVACGTGIASRAFASRGATVLGVELSAEMAAVAQRHGLAVEVSAFETWDPAGRAFDRVTCAQAWHWLDPAVSTEKAAAVLRTGGRLCLFWNIGHHPDELADELASVYRRVLPDDHQLVMGYAANRAREPQADVNPAMDALTSCSVLAEPQGRSYAWTRHYTRDEWLDELRTHSDHAVLPASLQRELLDEVGATIDRFGGGFDMPYTAVLLTADRR